MAEAKRAEDFHPAFVPLSSTTRNKS